MYNSNTVLQSMSIKFQQAFRKELAIFKATKKVIRDAVFFNNVVEEVIATREYAEAKTKGIILVSQDW